MLLGARDTLIVVNMRLHLLNLKRVLDVLGTSLGADGAEDYIDLLERELLGFGDVAEKVVSMWSFEKGEGTRNLQPNEDREASGEDSEHQERPPANVADGFGSDLRDDEVEQPLRRSSKTDTIGT